MDGIVSKLEDATQNIIDVKMCNGEIWIALANRWMRVELATIEPYALEDLDP